MIESIEELNFDEKMTKRIEFIEGVFSRITKNEGTDISLLEWINQFIEFNEEEILSGLSNREKVLFALGFLNEHIGSYQHE